MTEAAVARASDVTPAVAPAADVAGADVPGAAGVAGVADVAGAAEPGVAVPPAAERVGLAFKGAMVAMRRLRGRETHRPDELSYAQYSLLFGLCQCGGGMSARELADSADLSPGTVTQMLDSLAASGLVERVRSESDRRVVTTSLTERGAAVVDERRARMELRWRAALSQFGEDELLVAAHVLDRLRDMFEEYAKDGAQEAAAHLAESAAAAAAAAAAGDAAAR